MREFCEHFALAEGGSGDRADGGQGDSANQKRINEHDDDFRAAQQRIFGLGDGHGRAPPIARSSEDDWAGDCRRRRKDDGGVQPKCDGDRNGSQQGEGALICCHVRSPICLISIFNKVIRFKSQIILLKNNMRHIVLRKSADIRGDLVRPFDRRDDDPYTKIHPRQPGNDLISAPGCTNRQAGEYQTLEAAIPET
jgi:hypothetical protein